MKSDVIGDFGEEALDAGYYDIVHNVAVMCTDDVARELLRMELGLGIFPTDPDPIADLRQPKVVDERLAERVKERVAENRRRAYWNR